MLLLSRREQRRKGWDAMMGQSQRPFRGWLDREIIQTQDSTPPATLEWTCDVCGPQPPVALANNRWVRRRCRCERERLTRETTLEKRERLAFQRQEKTQAASRGNRSLTPLSTALARQARATEPPPAEFIWSCPTCGLIEPYALPSGRWIRRSCACERKQREERERQESLATWRHDQLVRTFGGWLGSHWIDNPFIEKMASKTFKTYDPMRQPEAYEKALAFAQAPQGNNLLFWGEYGLGKTHLEAAICNYVRDVGWRKEDGKLRPSGSIFVSAPQLFMVHNETRKAFDQTAHIRLMETLMGSPLLVIDDIDKKTPREWDWDIYWMIFEARYTARRPTILSTNKRADLARYIGEASLSRLSRRLVSVEMHGDDYRHEEQ